MAPVFTAPVGDSGAPKLPFVDQADSSFARFRRELQMRLQRHDTAYLYAILAPDIKSSFGGEHGIDGFKTVWKMANPDSSEVWSTLSRALALGGKLERDESNHKTYFIVPYVYANWPQNIDPFENVAVIDANVPVHEHPDGAAPIVARVSHSILPVEQLRHDGLPRPESFAKVTLPSGKRAWIRATHLYSPVGWRAFFEHRGDRWIMTIFVAGD